MSPNFHIKHLLSLCMIIAAVHISSAQLGVSVFYKNILPSSWNTESSMNYHSSHFIGGEVDYWFRLKKRRWEFMPAIQYSYGDVSAKNKGYQVGALLKNQIYIFDFVDDCNCPTFSKQGNTIKKSFFLALQLGGFYNDLKLEPIDQVKVQPKGLIGQLGLGLGFDIGITDFYTLTPSIHYLHSTPLAWASNTNTYESSMKGIHFGLRSGFRFDYKKKGRMRRF